MVMRDSALDYAMENGELTMEVIYDFIDSMKYFYPERTVNLYKDYKGNVIENRIIYDKEDAKEIKYLKKLRDLLNTLDFEKLDKRLVADGL